MFYITVDDEIELHLVQEHHHSIIFELLDANRDFITEFNDGMEKTVDDVRRRCLLGMERFASGSRFFLIYYKGQPVGSINLHNRQGGTISGMEIGYWLVEDFTGKGIMTRSTKTLTDYTFTNTDANRVFLGIATDNPRSYAIPERLGFTIEGTIRQNQTLRGRWVDHRIYAMLKSDWERPQDPPVLRYTIDDDLELRPVEKQYAQVIFAGCDNNREHIGAWLTWIDDTNTVEDTLGFIEASMKQYGNNDGFQAGIWHKGRFVGMIGYLFWNFDIKQTEIGYWLSKDATGHGIITRSTRVLVDYAFDTLGLNRIVIRCAVDNEKSANVAKRLGFTHEGIQRDIIKLRNGYTGAHIYSMLAKEWQTQ